MALATVNIDKIIKVMSASSYVYMYAYVQWRFTIRPTSMWHHFVHRNANFSI